VLKHSSTDAKKSELLKHDVFGGFTEPLHQALRGGLQLILDVSVLLLERNLPERPMMTFVQQLAVSGE